LPPAILAILFWCIIFPLASTYLLRKLRTRLLSLAKSRDAHAIGNSTTQQMWSIGCDLVKPYKPDYYYWDQILLARRLLLALSVSLVPQDSLYLPLLVLAILQLSALLQHWSHPYSHDWMNRAELCSLYLLLINYTTALVGQSSLAGGTSSSSNNSNGDTVWTLMLFFLNLLFMMALVAGLFAFVRAAVAAKMARMQTDTCSWLRQMIGGASSSDDNNVQTHARIPSHSNSPPRPRRRADSSVESERETSSPYTQL
jgi:hypothetical protein